MATAKVIELHNNRGQSCQIHCQPTAEHHWQYRRMAYHWVVDLSLITEKRSFAYKAGFARSHFEEMATCLAYLTPAILTETFSEFLEQDLGTEQLLEPASLYRDIGVIIVPAV